MDYGIIFGNYTELDNKKIEDILWIVSNNVKAKTYKISLQDVVKVHNTTCQVCGAIDKYYFELSIYGCTYRSSIKTIYSKINKAINHYNKTYNQAIYIKGISCVSLNKKDIKKLDKKKIAELL